MSRGRGPGRAPAPRAPQAEAAHCLVVELEQLSDQAPLPRRTSVVVIGAGISGLAAAYSLKSVGIEPIVLEREPYTGGRMSSECVGGYVIDRGAYAIGGNATNTLRLAHELAGPEALSRISPWQALYREGQVHRYRGDSLSRVARHPGISFGSRIILARMLLSARRNRQHLRLDAPDTVTYGLDNDSMTGYLLRAAGEEVLEYVAHPMTWALHTPEPEETSSVVFLAALLQLGRLELFNSSKGIGFLAEAIAARLDIRLGVGVHHVRADMAPEAGPVLLTLDDGTRLEADFAIVTVPAPQVAGLVPDLPRAAVDALREVPYASSTPVALGLGRPMSETAFALNLPRTEFRTVAAVTFEHNKHPSRVPEGRCLLMAYPGAEAGARLLGADDERVVRAVLQDVDKLYPRISSQVEFTRVYRWPHANAGLRPGDLARRAELRAALPEGGPVFFAGDYLHSPSSIESSLVSGLEAADRVLRLLGASA